MTARRDLKPLTALRFVAALLVFAYHAPAARPFALNYTLGQAGVGFFFVLSGFILTYTYTDGLTAAAGNVRAFYVARVARVYPAYAASTLVALVALTTFGGPFWTPATPMMRAGALLAQLLAIQAWIPIEQVYLGINSPAWSISVEAFFYALFPLLLRSLWRSFASSSAGTVFAAAALSWALAAAVLLIPHPVLVWTAYVFPPVRLVEFVVGMLVAIAFMRGYRVKGSATGWESLAAVAVVAAILAGAYVPLALRYALWLTPFWAAVIALTAVGSGAISRALSHPLFVRLGEISYAFYLLHVSALAAADAVLPQPYASAVALAATLGGAWALYAFIEQPLRVRIRALARPRSRAVAAA